MKPEFGETVCCGSQLADNYPPDMSSYDVIRLTGTHKDLTAAFGITDDILSRMIAVLGAPGYGKTELMLHIASQLKHQLTEDDLFICFDVKGDYAKELAMKSDFVLGRLPSGCPAKQVYWNIFAEGQFDARSREEVTVNLVEITKSLFRQRICHTTNEYFPNSARALLQAIILLRMLQAKEAENYAGLTNKGLLQYLDSLQSMDSWKQLAKTLRKYGFSQAAAHLDTREAASIVSELGSIVEDVFVGEFARNGSFSIRKYIRERGGNALFVEYDLAKSESLDSVFSLLIDQLLMETMSHPRANGKVYLLLDEFMLAKFANKLENAVAQGRSLNVRMICGIQSITSLRAAFGDSRADSILSNIGSLIAFHCHDEISRKLVQSRGGENLLVRRLSQTDGEWKEEITSSHTIQDWDILKLDKGDAIVHLGNRKPFLFHFDPYHNISTKEMVLCHR